MTSSEEDKQLTIRGIVVPLAWTHDGAVTSVGISAFDEREFVILSALSLGCWVALLRKEIEVVGVLAGSMNGLEAINVFDYRIIEKGV